MSTPTRISLCFLSALFILAGCRKDAFDEIYGRPDNLQPPIYQVLSAKGNFTNLLACIDKAGYKPILSASGYWTFFAPNDEAFQKYFTANSTSLAQIDTLTARKIVTYALVYNAFQTNHIADFQSPQGWELNNAYKRKTAYYDSFYTGPGPDGPSSVLISANRNGAPYVFGDENNKYIPYFFDSYMQANNLTAADYNFFFPSTTYTGFNVANAAVVNKDMVAENGVIHEVDNVILPLPNIEQKLASSPQFALFRSLFERFMVLYGKDDNATRRYFTQTGKSNSVYVKSYSSLLAFALGNESYVVPGLTGDNVSQTGGYTMFAPTDAALNAYLGVLLEFYGSVENLPAAIIADFLNAHLYPSGVFPSKFSSSNNSLGERVPFNSATDIVDKQLASNGMFYGTNKVQEANVFSSVYARAYLDPDYSIMTRLLDIQNARITIANPALPYTLFMLPDALLREHGYDFNLSTNQFTLTVNGVTSSGSNPQNALLRILNLNTVPENIDDLSGNGIAETNAGEYIRWNNNKVYSGGNVERDEILTVVGSRQYSNGKVYFLSNTGILDFPTGTVAGGIAANAGTSAEHGPYYDFNEYLIRSTVYNAADKEIIGLQLGGSYTVLIPTEAAMKQAVVDGFLPGTAVGGVFVSFNYRPSSTTDKDLVVRFIQTHILNGIQIAPDGKKSPNGTSFPTLLRNSVGDLLTLRVFNQVNNLRFEDDLGRSAKVTPPNNTSYFPATSSYLGNRTLFHQVDNYLQYKL